MEKVLLRHARALVPPLGSARAGYKGQAGKIGVLGGCAEVGRPPRSTRSLSLLSLSLSCCPLTLSLCFGLTLFLSS